LVVVVLLVGRYGIRTSKKPFLAEETLNEITATAICAHHNTNKREINPSFFSSSAGKQRAVGGMAVPTCFLEVWW